MCNTPVTLGGGITMVYGSRLSGLLLKYFLSSQCWYHLFSMACGSKFLESSIYLILFLGVGEGTNMRGMLMNSSTSTGTSFVLLTNTFLALKFLTTWLLLCTYSAFTRKEFAI